MLISQGLIQAILRHAPVAELGEPIGDVRTRDPKYTHDSSRDLGASELNRWRFTQRFSHRPKLALGQRCRLNVRRNPPENADNTTRSVFWRQATLPCMPHAEALQRIPDPSDVVGLVDVGHVGMPSARAVATVRQAASVPLDTRNVIHQRRLQRIARLHKA